MIRIAVCDDDPIVHTQLNEIFASYSISKNQEIHIFSYHTPGELIEATDQYDVLFLDIRFESDDVGIDTARAIRESGNECIIILLTVLHTKAIEGYEIGAFRYILKPISRDAIYDVLGQVINQLSISKQVIFVKQQYGVEIVQVNKILYIHTVARKRRIVANDQQIETWTSLKNLFDELPVGQFAYALKSYIVNYDKIAVIRRNEVELTCGLPIPVSRQYKDSFFQGYYAYIGK